ncbi:MAG: diguanylate cyclase [Lachnospiraceae bacterium]|nr:diguanylate cyclase [Lachnospiraceae bacterium]
MESDNHSSDNLSGKSVDYSSKQTSKQFSKYSSIGKKIYLFVGASVFFSALIVAVVSYYISADRIDGYFKNLSLDTARTFSTFVDAEFLKELREVAESEEYQALRDRAEEEDNEELVIEYLRDKGLWEDYVKNRAKLMEVINNFQDVKYLYIIAGGDVDATEDMYLLDDDTTPVYETGYYEAREKELYGMDTSKVIPPTISNGDWGWLCSAYAPVYADDGTVVCQIGCDVQMEDIMRERKLNLIYVIVAAVIITMVIVFATMLLISSNLLRPLDMITREMKKFSPSPDLNPGKSGVIDLDIKCNDEIGDIYNGIRSMQIRILDYLNDIITIQKQKEKAETEAREKEMEIGKISKDAYLDSLTGVGNKVAYVKKKEELNARLGSGIIEFAIVMVDVNFLKVINDKHGHAAGDDYLKGCCKIVCKTYKHSPVYRIGGDEFVVILTGDDYRDRRAKLKDLRSTFEETFSKKDVDPWLRYSAASGMSDFIEDDNDVDLVFDRADRAMYDDKEQFKLMNGIDPKERK